jgi:CRISPR/Cas system-associated endonuclease Cas1
MRKGLALAAVVLALAGCGQRHSGMTATTTASKVNDKAHALSVWKRFIAQKVRSRAALAHYKVTKFKADMDEPRDYGKGFKTGRGTAYVALLNAQGQRHSTIYHGVVEQHSDGRWAVKPRSIEPCFC